MSIEIFSLPNSIDSSDGFISISIYFQCHEIGVSSVARGLTEYADALFNGTMSNFFQELVPINVPFLSKHLDFAAFFLIIVIAILLSTGVKESTMLNNIFTAINLATVVTVIVSGMIKGLALSFDSFRLEFSHHHWMHSALARHFHIE